ncbi:MAG: hypothetical protein V4584_18040 [Verrucomicrobiota bacterium]
MLETHYYEVKAKILALAKAFFEGDEATRELMRKRADFFPIYRGENDSAGLCSLMIRIRGELFLVEDTAGGETGVFSLLLPLT